MVVVQLLSHVWLFVTPCTVACQAPLSSTMSQSFLKFMSVELVMLSNHFILCHPFSFCPQSFPASGSFPMSWLFASGDQSIRVSASASVFSMNIQDWFPLGLTGLVQGTLKSLFQHYSSKPSIFWCSAFFIEQLSHPYMTTGKTMVWPYRPLLAKWCSVF